MHMREGREKINCEWDTSKRSLTTVCRAVGDDKQSGCLSTHTHTLRVLFMFFFLLKVTFRCINKSSSLTFTVCCDESSDTLRIVEKEREKLSMRWGWISISKIKDFDVKFFKLILYFLDFLFEFWRFFQLFASKIFLTNTLKWKLNFKNTLNLKFEIFFTLNNLLKNS